MGMAATASTAHRRGLRPAMRLAVSAGRTATEENSMDIDMESLDFEALGECAWCCEEVPIFSTHDCVTDANLEW